MSDDPLVGAKPVGTVPDGFGCAGGELAIDGTAASELVRQAGGTPAFIYSSTLIRQRVARLRRAMPRQLGLHYAVKANPFEPLLRLLAPLVDGFDIASGGELQLVQQAGIDPARVSFAGPGKDDTELASAIAAGVVLNIESEGELDRGFAIAHGQNTRPRAALRVNPDFTLKGSGMKMGGGAKPFGIDAAEVPALSKRLVGSGADYRGLHIYTGSQALDASAVIAMHRAVLELAARLTEDSGHALPSLNMGGGFGIPYFPGDAPLDVEAVGAALSSSFDNLPPALRATQFHIELGRYLVGEAGVYLTRVLDRKVSHGRVFLVTDGGLHHQLAASGNFGTVVRRNYPVAIASRFDEQAEEVASIVGRLCTPLDRLADDAALPRAMPGDLVAVFCAGAYGATASPSWFLGHGPAQEILV